MSKLVWILSLTILALFSANTAVHAAGAANMASGMSVAMGSDMFMPACGNCDADDVGDVSGLACGAVCIASFAATLAVESASSGAPLRAEHDGLKLSGFAGQAGPPDPHPPQSVI